MVSIVLCLLLAIACVVMLFDNNAVRAEGGSGDYSDAYRNRLAYSDEFGWNNDPNGLLYVDGTYHMYYQYNDYEALAALKDKPDELAYYYLEYVDYKIREKYMDGKVLNVEKYLADNKHLLWGNMSWGHAVSTDLVHWEHKPIAIHAYQEDKDGNPYAMMFSGSAVYDEHNTSGLFDVDSEGKVLAGQGIVAVLTQPRRNLERGVDAQRQILAYSKDGGDSFEIYGEVLPAIDGDDGKFYEDFRDPKVFWSDAHEEWLMVVGGGSIRMYSSDNLRDWRYLGETGYWGECPDILLLDVDGESKAVLIMSPEDKTESHEYNGTTRQDTYYPAEYYVVGELNYEGLFVADDGELHRLSEGIDSYAFQSFNNTIAGAYGRAFGISWSASWKSINDYADEKYKRDYNGGMTVACELQLKVNDDGEYYLTRKPVGAYTLRSQSLKSYDDTLTAGENALSGVNADVADIFIGADFSESEATELRLNLRVSDFERISIVYDAEKEMLSLDRSESSLLAADSAMYKAKYYKHVPLEDGWLYLRILLDRAFISMFANDGYASFFSAVFPSAYSNGMELTADGDIPIIAEVSRISETFVEDGITTRDELLVTASEINTVVGKTEVLAAYSYAESFDPSGIGFVVKSGAENIELNVKNGVAYIKMLKSGEAVVTVGGKDVHIVIRENGFVSDIDFEYKRNFGEGDEQYITGSGLWIKSDNNPELDRWPHDAFVFSDASAKDFIYGAMFTPEDTAQAVGIVFGACDNLTHYYVLTADRKDNLLKLWEAGIGDLTSMEFDFSEYDKIRLTVVVLGGRVMAYVGDSETPEFTYDINDFAGGAVGLCAYNAGFTVNNVVFGNIDAGQNRYYFGKFKVLAVTDWETGKRLSTRDYTFVNGVIALTDEYINTLDIGRESYLDVETTLGTFTVTVVAPDKNLTISTDVSTLFEKADIVYTLSRAAVVTKITVNGTNVSFTTDGNKIIISEAIFNKIGFGLHSVKVYTTEGRLSTSFSYADKNANVPPKEPEPPVDYTFLIVDLCIFAAIILVFMIISYIGRRRERYKT